ncbi:MAG: D-cysteine desulfhydrase family protein [Candidatus Eisenbacteria bacterium]|uniref:D-cysteine desulfhydrase family protein n=1 Tax=Eiseniibacteriota bacterium TaxID=2212470 RepID=A0A948W3D5_UNCEI|nr:D-cysteine desulfhydrase family protein [Candidatus Eisenbacteria bacterium]MBU1950547.1 D-cysteine desulfhydrase family protein [Candidatus Eisenbacteria bacterium]MBU2690967.1 D-cysteine desulfhydrase family protein [Candidatus Eisenbacteria bacterium]
MDLSLPPRIPLAQLPTPVTPLTRLSDELGGPLISMKRDDLTGCELSGNKVRKLEYLLAEAQAGSASVVITCGGVQSNHARATAIAARKLGINASLVLRGDPPEDIDGNLLLSCLAGARIQYVGFREWNHHKRIMVDAARKLEDEGERPYIIPLGGSNALGSWGYISMLSELVDERGKIPYSHLFCAAGSGGTLAGLLLGRLILNLDIEILAVNVCNNPAYFQAQVDGIVDEFNKRHKTKIRIDHRSYTILEGYVGPGYAIPYDEEIGVIRRIALSEGIFLDPVYTGKAFYGLMDQLSKNCFTSKDHLLFIHTGGLFGLFPQRGALGKLSA